MVAGINRTPVSALVIAFVLALVTVSDVAGESLLHEMFKASGIIGNWRLKSMIVYRKFFAIGW